MTVTSDALGRQGEAAAEAFLAAKGLHPVARRYRAADGEIDLVMEDGSVVVFVEVKLSGRGQLGAGLCRVTLNKQHRLAHAAQAFLMEREWMERPARFDVVEITASGIYHVPCAFTVSGW